VKDNTVNISTDMAAASPSNDNELLATAPIISDITNKKKDIDATCNRNMFDSSIPHNTTVTINNYI
jgi:hypothetical protein